MTEDEKRGATAAMIAAMAQEYAARGECEAVRAQMWDDEEQLYYQRAQTTHHELRRPIARALVKSAGSISSASAATR
ncbi:hypothetical protein FOA52_002276 [Chlamydomonas sp. UWO 241]|nr:hypothetical protein FOA52_002276 [Chlamydomonas sp. UWO 241]